MGKHKLIIIRGLPGSGKTNLAKHISPHNVAADDFFMKDGVYKYESSKIKEAHSWCLEQTRQIFQKAKRDWTVVFRKEASVVVHNTFTKRWEIQPYIDLAEELDIDIVIISLFDGGCTDEQLFERNLHSVPITVIERMRIQFEHDWGDSNPFKPALRNRERKNV
jgi:predicted kinase